MNVDDELLALLTEQRHELTATKVLESDLDYAFQLQMQEAINASVALKPSSSSSSASPSDFQFQDDDVSDPGLAHLLYEEIAKFERERRDVEQVQAEMKRMQDDLNRRIHDQAFARELLGVPEEQWRKTGEHIQKPYGEGSSTSAESFRLYIKGLVNEVKVENVRNNNTLAGIGVVICDSTDSPIFELGKPLIGVETNREVGEMKALIEGLNAAVTLGIKRITIFCDDNSLYQYITGKWIPGQSQIGTMVDQVTLLQRKFTQCTPSLLARTNVNFAFKLAREAIISQGARPTDMIETCAICLEETDVDHMFSVDTCLHRYCFSCMKKHVEAKLHQGILPKCPHEGCKSEMKIDSCQKFLTPELFDIMSQQIKEASIPAGEKIYCPYPKCSTLMSKGEVRDYAGGGGQVGPQLCTKCQGPFCMYCKVPWHKNMSCNEYKRLNPYPGEEDAKLKNLAARNRWRQCVKCNHMVELAAGCYHIYCRCGYEFCYTCGAEWKNKQATCRCPIWDERNILYDNQNNNNNDNRRQRQRM